MDVIMKPNDQRGKYMVFVIVGVCVLAVGVIFTLSSRKAPGLNLDLVPSPTPVLNSFDKPTSPPTNVPQPTFAPVTELKIEDIKVGMGTPVASGSSVTVNYVGRLTNGQVFDTSLAQGRQPLTFKVGMGQVIAGWEEGLLGMKAGGQRRLIIPPNKAYGSQGAGETIPPNATLIFDIELLDVK